MKQRMARVCVPVLMATVMLATLASAQSAPPDRWLHVRVVDTGAGGESVRVNLPLALVEKVLPAIKAHRLAHGKVKLNEFSLHEMDIRGVLEAVRNTRDGEFVTVQGKRQDVRVAKQAGYLLVEVRERRDGQEREKVDIKLPFTVVEALLSGGQDELDVAAAVRALAAHGDAELVRVQDRHNTVRIWVDSKNSSE